MNAVLEPGRTDEPGAPDARAASPATAEPVIAVRQLTKRFDDVVAVDHLDLELPPGELFGLLGPNGAGKSTTIKMLATLLTPTDGDAIVAGASVRHQPGVVRERIGYVPQAVSADAALSGRENLWVSGRLYRVPRASLGARIDEALGFMELVEAADRQVRTYSGGMVRRLELAMAMLHRPVVLFLDEPTVGLDPTARAMLWNHIERLRDATGMTVLLTTHYMEEAEVLCDRVAIMHRGVFAAIGTPDALRAQVGPDATLDDAFGFFTGAGLETGGSFRDLVRTRRTARRLG